MFVTIVFALMLIITGIFHARFMMYDEEYQKIDNIFKEKYNKNLIDDWQLDE